MAVHQPPTAAQGGSTGSRGFAIGDSLTQAAYAGSTATSLIIRGRAQLAWAAMLSQGAIFHAGFSGTSGYTTAQILAVHVPVAIAAQPDFCLVLGGTNDNAGGLTVPQSLANLLAIYQQLEAAGITPVAMTIPPHTNAGASQKLFIGQLNAGIERLARVNRWPFVDIYSVLVDPTSGDYQAAYLLADGQNVHFNEAGAKVVGQAIVGTLSSFMVPCGPMLADWNGETAYLLGNQLMLTDSNADGVPDLWTLNGAGAVGTLPAAVTPGLGNLATVKRAAADASLLSNDMGPLVVGDRYRLGFRLSSTVNAVGGTATWQLQSTGAAFLYLQMTGFGQDVPANSVFVFEFVCPPGLANTGALMKAFVAAAVNAQAQIGQLSLIDLTAAGLA